jgi:hypothetical protein
MTVKELLLQAIDLSSETNLAQTLTFLQTLNQNTPIDEEPYDTPIEEIREGIYRGWQDVLAGRTKPVSQLWEGMDVD